MVKRFYATFDVLAPEALRLVDHSVELVRVDDRPVVGEWTLDGAPAGDVGLPLVLPTAATPTEYAVEATLRENTSAIRTHADELDEHVRARIRIAP
jgi:hypothetical protein